MDVQVVDNPSSDLFIEIERKIEMFNVERWEVKEKMPIAVTSYNDKNELQAGASARTFGLWLLIENIWVHENLRGQSIGSKMLKALEEAAIARGCQYALLDTLDFQARPFYEKFGYEVEWTQENYPKDGCKYFMVKRLI